MANLPPYIVGIKVTAEDQDLVGVNTAENVIGALNWIHHHGFTEHETQMDSKNDGGMHITFS